VGSLGRDLAACSKWESLKEIEKGKWYRWNIDTPYYEATTRLRVAAAVEDLAASSGPGGSEEAVVGVFDIASEEEWSKLRRGLEGRRDDHEAVETKVVLACLSDPKQSLEKEEDEGGWLSKCYDWCLENGFEYVEASVGSEELDESLTLYGDKQGVSRLVEVLHCHRWPGQTLKERQVRHHHQGEEEEEEEEAPPTSGDPTGDLEDFESLLAKVASARDQSAQLSDEERRKNAEKMLFKIMGHLGIEDEDEEGQEDLKQ